MKQLLLWGCVAGLLAGAYLCGHPWAQGSGSAGAGDPDAPEGSASYQPARIEANGVTEGACPEVAMRPEVAGAVRAVHAREGQDVPAGAVLLELESAPADAEVELAEAQVATARAELSRLLHGERLEKRLALEAVVRSKQAAAGQAKATYERSRRSGPAVSTEQLERDRLAVVQAEEELRVAEADLRLARAPARAEEVAAAEGRLRAAEARLRLARARRDRLTLRAPAALRVLQVNAEPGAYVGPATSQPTLLLADVSRCRVRAFVEELDACRVQVGQAVEVTADGLPGRALLGRVTAVLPRMGQRAPRTDKPEEFKDVYFREVFVTLDEGRDLPLNLRVRVLISTDRVRAPASAG
jgi:HlyD family secretion protein